MRAVRIHETGAPHVMQIDEVPMPQPGPGQVRVKVGAAGVNYIDTYQRSGQYRVALPFTLGQEAAGVIDAVGEGVGEFAPGQRAAVTFAPGCYAEYVVADAARVVGIPDGVEDVAALAGLVQGMTAHYLAHDTCPLVPGMVALVHAAAGGTGQLLVQMAKARGAFVIGTVGTAEKATLARALGADAVIVYTETDFEAETKRIMAEHHGGRGVDVVYDSVGRDTFAQGLSVLRPRGMMVLYGQSSGAVEAFDPQILNARGSLFLTRPSLGHYTQTRAELLWRSADVLGAIAAGTLRVRVDRTYTLDEAAAAHEALTSRATMGKIALVP
jgi:NADPH2:quinone reductase